MRKKANLVAGCCQFVLTFKDTQFFKLGNICRHENEEKYSKTDQVKFVKDYFKIFKIIWSVTLLFKD